MHVLVCPITNFRIRDRIHMELSPLREVKALQFDYAVLFTAIGDMDAPIYSKTIDFAPLMIDMSTEGRNAVWAKRYRLGFSSISLKVDFFTSHLISLFSGILVPVAQALTRHSILYTIRRTSAVQF